LLKGMLVGIIIAVPAGPVGVPASAARSSWPARRVRHVGRRDADAVFGIIAGFG
jgi:hypothetical protein